METETFKESDLPKVIRLKTAGDKRPSKAKAIELTKEAIVEAVKMISMGHHYSLVDLSETGRELRALEEGKWDRVLNGSQAPGPKRKKN